MGGQPAKRQSSVSSDSIKEETEEVETESENSFKTPVAPSAWPEQSLTGQDSSLDCPTDSWECQLLRFSCWPGWTGSIGSSPWGRCRASSRCWSFHKWATCRKRTGGIGGQVAGGHRACGQPTNGACQSSHGAGWGQTITYMILMKCALQTSIIYN